MTRYAPTFTRENDGHDPGHGPRAAALAEQIGHEPLGLSVDQLATLAHAMRDHDRGRVTRDPLVGACWDADRLDLPRVGITPDPRLLSTGTAADAAVIQAFSDFGREVPGWHQLVAALESNAGGVREDDFVRVGVTVGPAFNGESAFGASLTALEAAPPRAE